jgi:hypothetical protein
MAKSKGALSKAKGLTAKNFAHSHKIQTIKL